jgi:hypothetical protein
VINNPVQVIRLKNNKKTININDIPKTGEIEEEFNIDETSSKYISDRIVPVKLYLDIDSLKDYMNLSVPGRRLLDLIMYRIKLREDRVKIEISKFAKLLECSNRTVYVGIEDLIKSSFIVKYKNSEYWINPHRFFKGDRYQVYGKKHSSFNYRKKPLNNK